MASAYWEPEMVHIPAGRFWMGTDCRALERAGTKWEDWMERETPYHKVHLPDYAIGQYPVTNAQYAAFVQATGHEVPEHWEGGKPPQGVVRVSLGRDPEMRYTPDGTPQGKEDHPVVYVSWNDAMAYCKWLSQATGKLYRLPSEAEWEKAARGTRGRIYPWGNRWDASRCNSWEAGPHQTTPVGAYPDGASPYGLLDTVGNVFEWTRGLYRDYPYDPDDGREDPAAEGSRVLRGGAFSYLARFVRCAYRLEGIPDSRGRFGGGGFRLVASPVHL